MLEVELGKEFRITARDSSGSQEKYYKDGYWYKVDTIGNESISEVILTKLLTASNVSNFVHYELCKINGKSGCRCESFLGDCEQFLSLDKLFRVVEHKDLSNVIFSFSNVVDRFNFLVNFVESFVGLDITDYLSTNIALDMLCVNPDRHFKNLGIIRCNEGYRIAPIFDNGQSLGANWIITPPVLEEAEVVDAICTCTISGSPESQYTVAKHSVIIDYSKFYSLVDDSELESRNLRILKQQLRRYEREISKIEQQSIKRVTYSHKNLNASELNDLNTF